MSHDYGIACRTCVHKIPLGGDEYHERFSAVSVMFDRNCQPEAQVLIDLREPILRAHRELGGRVAFLLHPDWSESHASGLGEFLDEHEGHELQVCCDCSYLVDREGNWLCRTPGCTKGYSHWQDPECSVPAK